MQAIHNSIQLPSHIVVETVLRKYVRSGALDDFIRTRSLLKKAAASIAVKKAYKEAKHKIRPAILAAKNALLDKIEQEERANIIKSGFTTGAASESITVSGWKSEIAALEHYLLSWHCVKHRTAVCNTSIFLWIFVSHYNYADFCLMLVSNLYGRHELYSSLYTA